MTQEQTKAIEDRIDHWYQEMEKAEKEAQQLINEGRHSVADVHKRKMRILSYKIDGAIETINILGYKVNWNDTRPEIVRR